MQPGLVLMPLVFTAVQSFYYDWPIERKESEDRPLLHSRWFAKDLHQSQKYSFSSIFVRERRAKRLCGQKFIEHLLALCNSCILPAGSEIVKRSTEEWLDTLPTVLRATKRELSIAAKCCAGQCNMSELEALCCKSG